MIFLNYTTFIYRPIFLLSENEIANTIMQHTDSLEIPYVSAKTLNSLLRVFFSTFRWHVHKRHYMRYNMSREKQSGCLCKMILPCLCHLSLQSEMFIDWWNSTLIFLTDGTVARFYHVRCCTYRGTLNPTLNLRDSVSKCKHELKTHLLK